MATITAAASRARAEPIGNRSGHVSLRNAAAVMVAMNLGPVLLREPVARVMAIDPDDETIPAPFGPAMLDVFAALGEYVTTGPAHGLHDALEEVPR